MPMPPFVLHTTTPVPRKILIIIINQGDDDGKWYRYYYSIISMSSVSHRHFCYNQPPIRLHIRHYCSIRKTTVHQFEIPYYIWNPHQQEEQQDTDCFKWWCIHSVVGSSVLCAAIRYRRPTPLPVHRHHTRAEQYLYTTVVRTPLYF